MLKQTKRPITLRRHAVKNPKVKCHPACYSEAAKGSALVMHDALDAKPAEQLACTVENSFSGNIRAGKNTYVYDAHTYHTKVPPAGIAKLIEYYTKPGQVVLDPFCGSGMTGIAAGNLRQFLYFEEPIRAPNADDYTAEWVESGGGSRKGSRNLWIYEKATGKKRFSVTTSAGAKIQPYFDVPPPNNPNLYIFTVIGEVIMDGFVTRHHGSVHRARHPFAGITAHG